MNKLENAAWIALSLFLVFLLHWAYVGEWW
jgi:hypothetical protein